jgi:hypothetical protein
MGLVVSKTLKTYLALVVLDELGQLKGCQTNQKLISKATIEVVRMKHQKIAFIKVEVEVEAKIVTSFKVVEARKGIESAMADVGKAARAIKVEVGIAIGAEGLD